MNLKLLNYKKIQLFIRIKSKHLYDKFKQWDNFKIKKMYLLDDLKIIIKKILNYLYMIH